jgi:GNAT superfamily N-acetyltransferase
MSTGVTRREDGFALRALRVGVHPEALVMRVGTDVVVRTPVRPDHHDGNVTDLLVAPAADSIPGRIETAWRLMEPIGVRQVHLRYELGVDGPDDTQRVAALTGAGLRPTVRRVLTIDPAELPEQAPDTPTDVTLERLTDPADDVLAERRWYAASVLDRYAHGEDVDAWRAWDEQWGSWQRERIRALAGLRRAEVRLAARHSMPVASLTMLDDQDGMVVIDSIVTHPAHRRRGIARTLLRSALASLHGVDTLEHVAIATTPGSPAEALCTGVGFRPVADVSCWLQAPAGT